MYRQGDVLVVPVKQIPRNLKEIKDENGRVVLAYGEATGHTHSLSIDSAKLLEAPNGRRFLRVTAETALLEHQEHATIRLGAGNYEVVRQREYSPEAIRNVAD